MDNSGIPATPDKGELFERIVNSASGFAIFTTDEAGLTTSWNPGAERLLGHAEADMLGRSSDLIFTPEDRDIGAPDAERTLANATGRAEDERWHMRADGARFWGSGLLMPLTGSVSGFVKILRDLTERHVAEVRMREREELFRVLATNIPQLVFQTRGTGLRTWGSPQWIDFTGFDLANSVGYGWLEAIHPEDRESTLAAWRTAQETGDYVMEHRVYGQACGDYRWHRTRARPVGCDQGAEGIWVGTSTDIHDMRELQDRQNVLLGELQHRTRNLLAVVQSLATNALRRSSSLEAFKSEFGERLRALSRVQGMLAQTGHHAIALHALLAAELTAHGQDPIGNGQVHIEGPDAALSGQTAQALALALHELATNAVKHGALAQPTGLLAVTWRSGPDRQVVLEWRESGVTISQDAPRRKGYGTELIERALPYQLKTKTRLEFGHDGVRCEIIVPVDVGGLGANG